MILDDILIKLKNGNHDKAYTFKGQSFTYETFYKYICNIYHFLLLNNISKNPVIIYGNKEIYMKASFLACSYTGITYIPIDNSIPKDRVDSIIEQVKPYCIIGDFEYDGIKTISTKEIYNIMNQKQMCNIEKIYLHPEDIYYIIFTSGSTGNPKGVQVTYNNLDSCVKWLKEITDIKKGVVLNQAIFSFDLSVADLYLSLISGSEHFILENNKLNFLNIFESLKHSNANIAVMTPSFADLLLLDKNFNDTLLPNLKTILFCGEKLLKSTIQNIFERFKNIKIINSYGPTECTFAVTSIEITKDMKDLDNIPVGIPKKDVNIFIVDENKNKLPENKIGQIVITGESVADGYLGITKEKSFGYYEGEKAYNTGDLGYFENGILYYIDRMDNQIKFKGYRIELDDIEKNFYSLDYIDKVIIIAKKNTNNIITKLIAFVKLKNSSKTIEDMKKDISLKIPEYMMPDIKIINKFPINNNGKIDIQKLRRTYLNGTKNH